MREAIRNQGHTWNHKRIRRAYCELKLNLRQKPKKRIPARDPQILLQPIHSNYCWSIDFMSDALTSGQRFRTLNIIDDYNRQALGILAGRSMPTRCVTEYLDFIAAFRGYPKMIRTDNGPEFISKEFLKWAIKHQIEIKHIQPGKPAQNGFIERFNRTYREDILDAYLFNTITEVQEITNKWLHDYNYYRPHESLKNLSPIEFSRSLDGMPSRELYGAVAKQQQNINNHSTLDLY